MLHKRKTTAPRNLGTFDCNGSLHISDPCYSKDTWCNGFRDDFLPGTYHATMIRSDEGRWGGRVAELIIIHADHRDTPRAWSQTDVAVGVDSGQAGFLAALRCDNSEEGEAWYAEVCRLTLGDYENPHAPEEELHPQGGIFRNEGVVTSSGYGDGVYPLDVHIVDGKVVAARIVYIPESYDDDEEE